MGVRLYNRPYHPHPILPRWCVQLKVCVSQLLPDYVLANVAVFRKDQFTEPEIKAPGNAILQPKISTTRLLSGEFI
jgi:hypothetical protein